MNSLVQAGSALNHKMKNQTPTNKMKVQIINVTNYSSSYTRTNIT